MGERLAKNIEELNKRVIIHAADNNIVFIFNIKSETIANNLDFPNRPSNDTNRGINCSINGLNTHAIGAFCGNNSSRLLYSILEKEWVS